MKSIFLQEENYGEVMKGVAEPYLEKRKSVFRAEREPGRRIYCVRYRADNPKGVMMISHGFTENAEKYKEILYYFVKLGYLVYMPEHCGHGRSYRMTEDPSLVHVDSYRRYVKDFLYVSRIAEKENPGLPLYLYGHSMGGGIAAAAAAAVPELYKKVVLSSPMIRPATGKVAWHDAKMISYVFCKMGKGKRYVAGQSPYDGREDFEKSSSTSRARYEYYQEKRKKEALFQLNAASYGWLQAAGVLNRDLQKKAWRTIQAPVLLFQADDEKLVSKKEQERFIKKLARRGLGKMVPVPGSRHEIFNSDTRTAEIYWKMVFRFFQNN